MIGVLQNMSPYDMMPLQFILDESPESPASCS